MSAPSPTHDFWHAARNLTSSSTASMPSGEALEVGELLDVGVLERGNPRRNPQAPAASPARYGIHSRATDALGTPGSSIPAILFKRASSAMPLGPKCFLASTNPAIAAGTVQPIRTATAFTSILLTPAATGAPIVSSLRITYRSS